MFNLDDIFQLYTHVISEDIISNHISDLDILAALKHMRGIYSRQFNISKALNFNNSAYRCAYLHVYAPIYTAIVKTTMLQILAERRIEQTSESRIFRMCSLGGGPGSDVIGVLAAFDDIVSSFRIESFVTIIDCMGQWKSAFKSIVNEFKNRDYGSVASRFADKTFHWSYIEEDLLRTKNYKVWDAVSSSSFIVMNQFISILRTKDAEKLVKKVFRNMGPGSFVLLIDDASEKLTQMILKVATQYHFITVYGPLRNKTYSFEELKSTKFGYSSCYQAVVTALLLKKPLFDPERSSTGPESQDLKTKQYEESIKFCYKCSSSINPIMCSILKKSVAQACCMACEDDCSTPVSSKFTLSVSRLSFRTDTKKDIDSAKKENIVNSYLWPKVKGICCL